MEPGVRSFAALTIDDEAKRAVGRYCASLRGRPGGDDLKWVRPEIIHVTVRFFGALDRKQLEKARRAVAGLDGAWDPPRLSFGAIGAFPSRHRPQVVWLGIEDPDGGLAALAAAADRAIRVVGFGPADKPFVAHLTLARVGRGLSSPDLDELTSGLTPPRGALTIPSITLFRSDLRREGPLYTPLEIARPRSVPPGSAAAPGAEAGGPAADDSSTPPRARRTGQDPVGSKEGEPADG